MQNFHDQRVSRPIFDFQDEGPHEETRLNHPKLYIYYRVVDVELDNEYCPICKADLLARPQGVGHLD